MKSEFHFSIDSVSQVALERIAANSISTTDVTNQQIYDYLQKSAYSSIQYTFQNVPVIAHVTFIAYIGMEQ